MVDKPADLEVTISLHLCVLMSTVSEPMCFLFVCRVVAEHVVDKPADLDVATVMSMGFPAYK